MTEHGGRGKFVAFNKHHFIADNEDLANQLCDLLPLPCIVNDIDSGAALSYLSQYRK